MPLEPEDLTHLRAASGYCDLGMWPEANEALENITPEVRHVPEVLHQRVLIYQGLRKWDAMSVVAQKLIEWAPDNPEWIVLLAYAKRREESLQVAHATLLQGQKLHPEDGTILFNLACYQAQLGELEEAKKHLHRAIEINPRFKLMALEDQDLAPIW